MSDLQQSSSRTAVDSTDFTNIEWNQQYGWESSDQCYLWSKKPRKTKILFEFAHIAENLATQKKFVGHWKQRNLMKKKRFPNRKTLIPKITQTNKSSQIFTDPTRTITLMIKEVIATVQTLQTAIVAEVTVTLELFAFKQDLTTLNRCMTHCSHAIF